jgi:GDP-4-dehydro-6-deoxy-D-mannose reductase
VERPVIVTGAAGFAGGHLVERLAGHLPASRPLIGWVRPGGRLPPEGSAPRVSWQPVDLLDRLAVDAAVASARPTVVYHCAGSPHVASSWSDTLIPLQSNVESTHYLLLALERHSPDTRVMVPSSALVYGAQDFALDEGCPLAPRTPYGVSKLAQEMLALCAGQDFGMQALIARPFNHIGPRQDASFVAAAFARQIAEAEAGFAEPVIRVGNLDARRDLTDVRDTVRAYVAIAERGLVSRVYNVCSGQAHRIGDLLEHLLSLARVRVSVHLDADRLRPSDTPLLLGNGARIARELGWSAEIPMQQTLADLLADWRARALAGRTRA